AVGVDVERYRVRRDQHRLVAFVLGRHLDSDVLGQYADAGRFVVLESRSRGIEAATLNADTLSEARLALSSVCYGDAFRRRQLDVSSQYREGRNGGGDAGRFGVLVDDRTEAEVASLRAAASVDGDDAVLAGRLLARLGAWRLLLAEGRRCQNGKSDGHG